MYNIVQTLHHVPNDFIKTPLFWSFGSSLFFKSFRSVQTLVVGYS